mgnify:FL=1|tara:strand:- start:32 stop:211 length:180 start_codon:yes stop_codon:yes gene_type:complete
MAAKIIEFISRTNEEDHEIIEEALQEYDELLHSEGNLLKAIQVRAILGELRKLKNERIT